MTKKTQFLSSHVGKIIEDVFIKDNYLVFKFTDGTSARLYDNAQSCCERRYMTVDGDDLSYWNGSSLIKAEISEGPTVGDTDTEFLNIYTNRGVFVVVNHNEHNGYYGGFLLTED